MVIEKALRSVVLGSIFALPFIVFIVAQSLFFPYITGKNFAFRILIEIGAAAYLGLVLINPAYRPKRSWLLAAFALFVLIIALADAVGVSPFKSFWSNYERMDGWVTLAHLFLYFVVASSVLNTEKLWRTFLHVLLVVSALVGLHGLLQVVGLASLSPGFSSTARIDATLGNPIYLAVYMLFHIGIAASLWAKSWEERSPGRRLTPSLLYGGVIALDTLVLFLTGTRGTMLGLIGGTLLAALLIALSTESGRRKALGVVLGITLFAGAFWLLRDSAVIQKVPFLKRLATISLEDSTTKARFYNWGMALQGVKERPILGWGQENYAVVFDKYYDPRMYAQEQWFDRVHNIVFDWLVAAGILGLLSYLALLGAALYLLWRGPFNVYERTILTGLIAAYFFHNLFVFDNITSYLLFATVLAYIAWRASTDSAPVPLPSVPTRFSAVVAGLALVVVWGTAWYVNARPLSANRALLQALAPQQGGLDKNFEYFQRSIAYGSFGTQEAREQLTQAAAQMARIESVPFEVKKKYYDAAVQEMILMAQASPLDARHPLFLGVLLDTYGDFENGATVLEKAHELSPGKQTILFELGSNGFARGDIEGALATYKKAFELAPEFLDARLYYAAAAIRAGELSLADELLAPVIPKGSAADARIAAAYVSRSRYDKIAEIWEARIKVPPVDSQAYFTLAAAHYGAGNPSRAVAALEEAIGLFPGSKAQIEALIGEIRAGTAKVQ